MFSILAKYIAVVVGCAAISFAALLATLTTPFSQAHVVYLHAIQMTWFKDLDVPELFGFLHNQVTPFNVPSGNGLLYAWHLLPVEIYRQHEDELLTEPSGWTSDITSRLAFRLLRDDPEALLVIHMHGAGGTVGSGYRAPNYRALSSGRPDKIHVLTFDYRGFGRSSGTPSEEGVLADAIAVVEWAMQVAQIPPQRILIFGQSLGTAVNIAVGEYYAKQEPAVVFAGHILVAPFVDVATLVATYSIAGTVPILGPLARLPLLFDYLRTFVQDTWSTKDRIAEYVRSIEASGKRFHITIIHAEDDYDIPWQHTSVLFRHAVNATLPEGVDDAELDKKISASNKDRGAGGSTNVWKTANGVIREQILKTGLHDVVMGYPVITLAVMRIFAGSDAS